MASEQETIVAQEEKLALQQQVIEQLQQQQVKLMSACGAIASVYEDQLEGQPLDRDAETPVRNEDIYQCWLVCEGIAREDSELFTSLGNRNVTPQQQRDSDAVAREIGITG